MPAEKWTTNIMNNVQKHSHRQGCVLKKNRREKMWQQQSHSNAKEKKMALDEWEGSVFHYWPVATGRLAHCLKIREASQQRCYQQ